MLPSWSHLSGLTSCRCWFQKLCLFRYQSSWSSWLVSTQSKLLISVSDKPPYTVPTNCFDLSNRVRLRNHQTSLLMQMDVGKKKKRIKVLARKNGRLKDYQTFQLIFFDSLDRTKIFSSAQKLWLNAIYHFFCGQFSISDSRCKNILFLLVSAGVAKWVGAVFWQLIDFWALICFTISTYASDILLLETLSNWISNFLKIMDTFWHFIRQRNIKIITQSLFIDPQSVWANKKKLHKSNKT